MKATSKIMAASAAATFLVALGAAAALWSFRQIEEGAQARQRSHLAIVSAGDLLFSLRDAESSQRAYALSGDQASLAPYPAARDRMRGHLEELRRLAVLGVAEKNVDALGPLMAAKLAEMSQVFALRRDGDPVAALKLVRSAEGRQLMDSIRSEISGVVALEEASLRQHEATSSRSCAACWQSSSVPVSCCCCWHSPSPTWVHRPARPRSRTSGERATDHSFEAQEAVNEQLQQANATLRDSEEKLAVTLNSIGDAVIATDARARVMRMNPVAEQLTGWTQAEATGRPVEEVFHIINQETRQPSTIPVMETLAHGTKQGLANHTVLIARDGSERAIADSCAPDPRPGRPDPRCRAGIP
jgi:two-component system sensor histidine kinase EvgS